MITQNIETTENIETTDKVAYAIVIAMVIYTIALVYFYALHFQKQEKEQIITNNKYAYQQKYIQENPSMIAIINKYNVCKKNENDGYAVVEGCLKNSTTNNIEKLKLENYLKKISEVM
jgi:Na+/H+ antiporter NhaC